MNGDGLSALKIQVSRDLEKIAHPRAAWLEPQTGPDGQPAYDVIIVGAGQSGLATAFGLLRSRVTNILVLDKAPKGQEGPWRATPACRRCAARKTSLGLTWMYRA